LLRRKKSLKKPTDMRRCDMTSQAITFEKQIPDGACWSVIDEEVMIHELYRYVRRVTPMIKQMLQGEVVVTGHGNYRIRTGE
jgi:hypothetical protein